MQMPDRVVPTRTYVLVCVGLLVLTALTFGIAHVNLGGLNGPVALGIAAAKAALIAAFFMHLRSSWTMTRVAGIAGLLWLAILIVGTMDDILTRGWLPIPGK